jgi:hypothetical protein
VFGIFKKAPVVMTHPEPEVELRRLFVELLGETESRLREVQDAVNHFVMMFDVDERILNKVMSSGRERAAHVADNVAHIEKLFAMAEGYEKQGMHDKAVEVKLVALYLACNIMDCSFEQKSAQNKAIMLFETFKQSGVIELNPPRRVHISPID